MCLEELVRLYAHEAQRLFQDRLVEQSEKEESLAQLALITKRNFKLLDIDTIIKPPLLFS